METQVREILVKHSGLGDSVSGVDAGENLWQLGMTSLASVQVMVALEETFGVEIPDDKLRHATFASVDNIMSCMRSLSPGVPDER
ncbi:acyl carrier protein [Micromonospora sp. NPDC093277]|uniref:acyl carrier protein n=1 Tax=Micromonospora sp. NPDC093277 TaxID=3364291 RepID=UPI00380ADCBE